MDDTLCIARSAYDRDSEYSGKDISARFSTSMKSLSISEFTGRSARSPIGRDVQGLLVVGYLEAGARYGISLVSMSL